MFVNSLSLSDDDISSGFFIEANIMKNPIEFEIVVTGTRSIGDSTSEKSSTFLSVKKN